MRFEGQAYIGETPAKDLKDGDIITYRAKDGGEGIMVVDPKTRKLKQPKQFQPFRVEIKDSQVNLIPIHEDK